MKLKIFWTLFVFVICMTFTTCQQNAYDSDTDDDVTTVKTAKLGNGNYTQTCFLLETQTGNVENEVNNNLATAESYIKGLVNGFSNSLNDRPDTKAHFDGFIKEANSISFDQDQGYGFDWTILRLRDACKPIFKDIIQNLSDPVDRSNFINYYWALSNEVYKYGFDKHFKRSTGNFSPENDYNDNKESVIRCWNDDNYNNPNPPIDDFAADIQEGCTKIVTQMDNLIEQAAPNMGNGITTDDLRKVVNLSFNINSLDAMHDYYGDIYEKHQNCSPVENETLDTFMNNIAITM